jgi:unsaturated rhamnogalacturonyl hydrolase
MSAYFAYDESIYNQVGDNIPRVLEIIANRYIGQNPPLPFMFRAYSLRGLPHREDGRDDLNLAQKWPRAKIGQWAYVCGRLWSENEGQANLRVSAYSPTSVFVNGKPVYTALLAHETDVQSVKPVVAPVQKGWNSFFIKTCKTPAGFGCILGTAAKTWIPLHFMAPFIEREGQAGWAYSQPGEQDIFPEDKLPNINESEQTTGLAWFPSAKWDAGAANLKACARIYGAQPGKTAYAWTSLYVADPSPQNIRLQIAAAAPAEIWVDGAPVWDGPAGQATLNLALSHGRHDVLVASVSASADWGCDLSGAEFHLPHPVKGVSGAWLYLGPFDAPLRTSPTEIQTLYRCFDNNRASVYWRADMPETYIRPYVETENFGKGNYPLGVTLYGLLQTARMLGRQDVKDYVVRHVSECARLYPYSLYDRQQFGYQAINHHLVEMSSLDDCGSFGAAMLETYKEHPTPECRAVLDAIADYILNKQVRTPDGAFYRVRTLWIDDLYMSTPFLSKYYQLSGEQKYIDDAAHQFLLFKKYLFLPELKIMSHVYDFGFQLPTGIPWGRGNGWCLFSLSEVLELLPADHPERPALLEFFIELCQGYLALQGKNGLWHQVLTEPDSYEETSCTAMFAYAFARGVRMAWLKEPAPYIQAVSRAWQGLARISIDRFGNVHGVCRGSSYAFTSNYYKYELLWQTNNTHGIGIVMLAGIEAFKLGEWLASKGK